MIYMIGGVPRVGKTQLTHAIIKRRPMHAVSTDGIRYMLQHAFPKDALSKDLFLPSLADQPMDPNIALAIQNAEARALWPDIIEYVRSFQDEDIDVLVEGTAVIPELITECPFPVTAAILSNNTPDHDKILMQEAQNNPHDWLSSHDLVVQRRYVDFFAFMDADLRAQAAMFDVQIIDIHDETFAADIEAAVDVLLQSAT